MTTTPPLINTTDEVIRTRLASLMDMFFPALRKGGDALASFSEAWTSFNELVDEYSATLKEETRFMVHSFAQMLTTVASTFVDTDSIHKELELEIAKLSEIEFKKLSLRERPTPGSQPRYIELCYKWLLSHLMNPYPSKNIRTQISRQTGSSEEDIGAWFVDVRKRIGWNDLRKARFENRADMIKAATQFFQPQSRPLQHTPYNRPTVKQLDSTDYSPEFASIEDRARSLYSDKFFPTALATELTVKELPSYSRTMSVEVSKPMNTTPADPALSYPSPGCSPNPPSKHVSLPSLLDSTSKRNRKRKNSSVEPEARSESESRPRPQRPLKRSRINNYEAVDQDAIASLPSPMASIQGLPAESPSSPSAISSPHDVAAFTPSQKRQRSSSDTDDERSSRKRQRYLSGANDEHSSFSPSASPSTSDVLPPFVTQTSLVPSSQERDQLPSEATSDLPLKDPLDALTNPLLLSNGSPSPSSSINVSVPSLALSVQPAIPVLSPSRPSTLSTPLISTVPVTNSIKRKRRLSDADDQMRAKRPHNAMVTPRHQTVSDPFPISKPADSDSFAHWWQECIRTGQEIDMAKTPMPVVEILDESTPLDVHYENYNYADLASSIPEFNQWTDYAEPLMDASLSFSDTPVDQPFTSASENMSLQHNLPDFGNIPFTSHNSVFNANANEFSEPYSNTSLFLPGTIDQTTGMPLFAGLDLAESWTFDEFIPGPQLFENNIPQFTHDFTSTIPQSYDDLAYADKLAKQRRVERLQEELRLAQAELAS